MGGLACQDKEFVPSNLRQIPGVCIKAVRFLIHAKHQELITASFSDEFVLRIFLNPMLQIAVTTA